MIVKTEDGRRAFGLTRKRVDTDIFICPYSRCLQALPSPIAGCQFRNKGQGDNVFFQKTIKE